MKIDELKSIVKDCGVAGAGGAGFPTYLKIDSRADTIILNCAECEPLFSVHRQLLARYAGEILSALCTMSEAMSASVIIAIKKSYHDTIASVREKMANYSGMRLALLDDAYPAGDEIILIYDAAGKVIPPGGLPVEHSCAVFNVETVYNIYNALRGIPVTHKWLTIAGEVTRPVTARIAVGAKVREAVQRAGAITTANPVYITGGPMMGGPVSENDEIKKTTNALLILPADHPLARRGGHNPSVQLNRAASACCQCRACTDMCPRYLLGYPLEPHRVMRALRAGRDFDALGGAMYCGLCGLCEAVACPQSLAPRELIRLFKSELAAGGIKPEKREAAPVSAAREYRRVDEARLTLKLGLAKYDVEAPMED